MTLLIPIVIQLFSYINDALNDILGAKRGRSLAIRVGLHWTVITLGTVVAAVGLALLAAQTLKWNDMTSTPPGTKTSSISLAGYRKRDFPHVFGSARHILPVYSQYSRDIASEFHRSLRRPLFTWRQ